MAFASKNLNYIYNVEYYSDVNFLNAKSNAFADKNKDVLKMSMSAVPALVDDAYTHCVTLKTTYPGLAVGIGPMHEIGADNEFSLGITLDYTTGAPYIPGSTIKGVIKSAFENEGLIRSLLGMDTLDVKRLKESVFEGIFYDEKNEECKLSVGRRDVFFDAFPTEQTGTIFDEDYITPHGEDLTKNPIPIKFIKVKPNIRFSFCFKLFDYSDGDICVTAEQKCGLFKDIIMLMGMGAKTNVGYGAFAETDKSIMVAQEKPQQTVSGGGYGGQGRSGGVRGNGYGGRPNNNRQPQPAADDKKPCKKCGKPIDKKGPNFCSKCYSEMKKG